MEVKSDIVCFRKPSALLFPGFLQLFGGFEVVGVN
ncbi:MAG: hypothetical protein J07AB43_04440 [Candidatus Nanosalina sp. J07AB43]|nr:MAG: hypothetical protein J07AB43_04440 [Candidatus Nanosalina sp. J07AB43]